MTKTQNAEAEAIYAGIMQTGANAELAAWMDQARIEQAQRAVQELREQAPALSTRTLRALARKLRKLH